MANKIKASNIDTNAITADSISYPLTTFSSTGIDDNATSTAITINSSQQVGIGTASPTSKLQVEGSTTINSTGTPPLTIHHTDGTTVALAFQNDASDNHSLMFTDGDFRINYDGSEKMRIDSSGNVGIGTTSPGAELDVYGGILSQGEIRITNGGGNPVDEDPIGKYSFYTTDVSGIGAREIASIRGINGESGTTFAGELGFYTSPFNSNVAEAMRIDKNGNVGIGTTGPSSKLHVNGNFTSTGIDDNATSTSLTIASDGKTTLDATNETPLFVHHSDGSTVKLGFGNNSSNSLDIGFIDSDFVVNSNGAERVRINSSGYMNIGDTVLAYLSSTKAVSVIPGTIYTRRETTLARGHLEFYNPNGAVGSIVTTNSSTAYNTTSDYRLKENVSYDFDATTRLKQLKPARFNFIADANITVDGFLAHEVQDVVPEAITGTKDAVQVWEEGEELPEGVSVGDNKLDENGNTIPKYQGIDQSKLVPILTKALQEAVNKIETLEARITALENE